MISFFGFSSTSSSFSYNKVVTGIVVAFLIGVSALSTNVSADGKINRKNVLNGEQLTASIKASRTIVVDSEGKGEFKSVQEAVNAVPDGNPSWVIIDVRKGRYREKVTIPQSKPFIFMKGSGMTTCFIMSSQSAPNNMNSATFKVQSSNFMAYGLSIKNDAPTGAIQTSKNQSVAVEVGGDKVSFHSCGFFSTHNTLFDYKGKHVYDNCYIQGSIDFIFGRAKSYFYECELFVIGDLRSKIFGSITAQNREKAGEDSGYVFYKGEVYGTRNVYLGRAKGPYSRVIFANSYMSKAIAPEGWTNWSFNGTTDNLYFAEYECFGPGSGTFSRVPWSKQLTDAEAKPFLTVDFVNGKEWLPVWTN